MECNHRSAPVKVGAYTIYAGGMMYFQPGDATGFDILIPLAGKLPPLSLGEQATILSCPWEDFSPPPKGFLTFLRRSVIPALKAGKKILIFCSASHGRTGTFLASLIALLEPGVDPIVTVRERHCRHAVETPEQERFIRKIRNRQRRAKNG